MSKSQRRKLYTVTKHRRNGGVLRAPQFAQTLCAGDKKFYLCKCCFHLIRTLTKIEPNTSDVFLFDLVLVELVQR